MAGKHRQMAEEEVDGGGSCEWCCLRLGWLQLLVWPLAKKEIEKVPDGWLSNAVELAKIGGGLASVKVAGKRAERWVNKGEEVVGFNHSQRGKLRERKKMKNDKKEIGKKEPAVKKERFDI